MNTAAVARASYETPATPHKPARTRRARVISRETEERACEYEVCFNFFTPPEHNAAQRFCSHECQRFYAAQRSADRRRGRNPNRHIRRGQEYLHRLIVEEHLGRRLTEDEVVHHRNGDKHDNRLENLEVLEGQAAHAHIHALELYYERCDAMRKRRRG